MRNNVVVLCWDLDQTNSPTLARHGDGLGDIMIWAIPPNWLTFWDGAPVPYKWYQSHAPNLVVLWVGVVFDPPNGCKKGALVGLCEAIVGFSRIWQQCFFST